MFTQCPECQTVYEVAPADLAVAGGMVRCGECSRTFSALKALAESPLEFETAVAAGDETEADAETVAAALPDETDDADDADDGDDVDDGAKIAKAVAAASALATRSGQTQQDPVDPDDAAIIREPDEPDEPGIPGNDERAGDDIDETATFAQDENEDAGALMFGALADGDDELADDDDSDDEIVLDEFYEPPDSDDEEPVDDDEDWEDDERPAREADGDVADESALFSLPVPELRATGIVNPSPVPEKLEGGEAAIDPFAQDSSDGDGDSDSAPVADTRPEPVPPTPLSKTRMQGNDAVDAEDARDLRDYLRAPPPGQLAAAGWIGGSVLLALLLLLQIVHHNRGDLVVHPRFGAAVASVYDLFGIDVRPNWRVDDYKIVGQARLIELEAEESADQAVNALRFVAIIANRADRPQPPPMVRITLRDRWGDPRGVRDFAPPEYLTDRSMVDALLEPGQRLRVVLNLRDPGAEIDGFDFDMCLPDRQGTLRCSSEPAG